MPTAGLPEAFVARMRGLLGRGAPAFLDSYRRPAQRAVRANPLKLDPADLPGLLGIDPDPVPWCPEAFFLPQGARVGDTMAHAAGLCYLQEPSALAVGAALDLRPGQRVLDLAAAPGGKATLVAGRLGGRGVVVANEVQRGRVQALADNLDRWGSGRTMLAADTVARLAERLPGRFDRVLLDAPCSGEGLFRRTPAAAAQWRPGHVRGSAERQRALLADAALLVRPGGVLVYSTCTFAPEENERQVAGFLAAHPGWRLLDIPGHEGFAAGRPDWAPDGPAELVRTVRLWPHRLRGEGHFVAKLGRPGGAPTESAPEPPAPPGPGRPPGRAGGGRRLAGVCRRCPGGGAGAGDGGRGAGLPGGRRGAGRGRGPAGAAGVAAGAGPAGAVRAGARPGHGRRDAGGPAGQGAGGGRGRGLGAGGGAGPPGPGRLDGGRLERLAAGVGAVGRGEPQEPLPQGSAYDETLSSRRRPPSGRRQGEQPGAPRRGRGAARPRPAALRGRAARPGRAAAHGRAAAGDRRAGRGAGPAAGELHLPQPGRARAGRGGHPLPGGRGRPRPLRAVRGAGRPPPSPGVQPLRPDRGRPGPAGGRRRPGLAAGRRGHPHRLPRHRPPPGAAGAVRTLRLNSVMRIIAKSGMMVGTAATGEEAPWVVDGLAWRWPAWRPCWWPAARGRTGPPVPGTASAGACGWWPPPPRWPTWPPTSAATGSG